jgi:hypothetical protein
MKRLILLITLFVSLSGYANEAIDYKEVCVWSGYAHCEKEYFVTKNAKSPTAKPIIESHNNITIGDTVKRTFNQPIYENNRFQMRPQTAELKVEAIFQEGSEIMFFLSDSKAWFEKDICKDSLKETP